MEKSLTLPTPGEGLKTQKMPGHWVLARMGKRVLRPGGIELTHRMLADLGIHKDDEVVEFAPGIGITTRLVLKENPKSYVAVERDLAAAKIVTTYLRGEHRRCVTASADQSGLPEGSATVVFGEAMLTMQTSDSKRQIVHEAQRLLRVGGRYAIHEMCIMSENLDSVSRSEIETSMSRVIRHGARPLTVSEWRHLLESEGFQVQTTITTSMSLLEPVRLVRDEGVVGALRFLLNVLTDRDGRRRVLEMRSVFRRHRQHLGAVTMIGVKT